MTLHRSLAVPLVAALCHVGAARAQTPRPLPRWEVNKFDFHPDGVWRRQARQVARTRARLLASRRFTALNAPMMSRGGGAVAPLSPGAPLAAAAALSGVLRVPAILFKYQDTPAGAIRFTAGDYDQALFSTTPPLGRPYTYRTFYQQLSNGLLSIQGKTYGYVTLANDESKYNGGTSLACLAQNPFKVTNCNGFWSDSAYLGALRPGLIEALQKVDYAVDWTQYDSDGDGYVDLVLLIPPTTGGECGPEANPNNHLWSHRGYLYYRTHSRLPNGLPIAVRDYILESGVGGADGCDSTAIMPIGTVAHETGHGLGLPDLYDVSFATVGIGDHGLMAYGGSTSPLSPSRMEAWSLHQLGWVTVVPLLAAGQYDFGPAPASQTAFYLPVLGSNPRGEYFLLENRQAVQSDSALLDFNCRVSYAPAAPPASCGGGLLVWHIDSIQVANAAPLYINTVNAGPIHGVALVQADGFGNLDADRAGCQAPTPGCWDYGDAGDPYPGTTGNVALTPTSTPAALRNADGQPAGFVLDQITQVAPNGAMAFRLTYPVWVVRAAADTSTFIKFDGVAYHVFRGILSQGSVHTVAVDSAQYTAGGRTAQVFVAWSDGGARSHQYTAGASPETLTVSLARLHRLDYSATNGGSVAADTGGTAVASGSFLAEHTPATLTATAGSLPFISWVGDTVSKSATLTLPMGRPYSVRAAFLAPLNTADVVTQLLNGSGPLTAQQLADLDQLGNNNGRFDVGDFLAWVQATGAPLSAPQRALVSAVAPPGVGR